MNLRLNVFIVFRGTENMIHYKDKVIREDTLSNKLLI